MASIHFKCSRSLNLHHIGAGIYDSGTWDVSPSEAAQLVGGTLYLHEKKASPSYFGGTVLSFTVVDVPEKAHSRRIVFRIRASDSAKGKAWRGENHRNAWTSRVLP